MGRSSQVTARDAKPAKMNKRHSTSSSQPRRKDAVKHSMNSTNDKHKTSANRKTPLQPITNILAQSCSNRAPKQVTRFGPVNGAIIKPKSSSQQQPKLSFVPPPPQASLPTPMVGFNAPQQFSQFSQLSGSQGSGRSAGFGFSEHSSVALGQKSLSYSGVGSVANQSSFRASSSSALPNHYSASQNSASTSRPMQPIRTSTNQKTTYQGTYASRVAGDSRIPVFLPPGQSIVGAGFHQGFGFLQRKSASTSKQAQPVRFDNASHQSHSQSTQSQQSLTSNVVDASTVSSKKKTHSATHQSHNNFTAHDAETNVPLAQSFQEDITQYKKEVMEVSKSVEAGFKSLEVKTLEHKTMMEEWATTVMQNNTETLEHQTAEQKQSMEALSNTLQTQANKTWKMQMNKMEKHAAKQTKFIESMFEALEKKHKQQGKLLDKKASEIHQGAAEAIGRLESAREAGLQSIRDAHDSFKTFVNDSTSSLVKTVLHRLKPSVVDMVHKLLPTRRELSPAVLPKILSKDTTPPLDSKTHTHKSKKRYSSPHPNPLHIVEKPKQSSKSAHHVSPSFYPSQAMSSPLSYVTPYKTMDHSMINSSQDTSFSENKPSNKRKHSSTSGVAPDRKKSFNRRGGTSKRKQNFFDESSELFPEQNPVHTTRPYQDKHN